MQWGIEQMYVCIQAVFNLLVNGVEDVAGQSSRQQHQVFDYVHVHGLSGDDAKPSLPTLIKELTVDSPSMVYIAHVRNNSHFVLLTGWNSTSQMFTANDPNYHR